MLMMRMSHPGAGGLLFYWGTYGPRVSTEICMTKEFLAVYANFLVAEIRKEFLVDG
jgi:hypothetical protein